MTATFKSKSKYLDLNPLVPLRIPSALSWTDAEISQLSTLYPSVNERAKFVVQYLLDHNTLPEFLSKKGVDGVLQLFKEENDGQITEPAVASLIEYANLKASQETEAMVLESTVLSIKTSLLARATCEICSQSFKHPVLLSCGDVFCGSCIQSWWEKELEERFKGIKCHPPLKIARSSSELLLLRNRISCLGRPYEKALSNYCPECSAQIRRAPTACANFASFITDCLTITHRSDDPAEFSNIFDKELRYLLRDTAKTLQELTFGHIATSTSNFTSNAIIGFGITPSNGFSPLELPNRIICPIAHQGLIRILYVIPNASNSIAIIRKLHYTT
ncbi:hypothetical protein HYPSUDRAFT_56669 [Hypholoma sublateritium FD-334 SS-4]|uniref:RING-type domain-containing protein n=1 Tax=Hypholoma sublateritium (strain FD-334 SS-4) TaxID=945553 RepID=A0A0D2NKJ8_HYPSF|nr:hypothetical protein HYPSUDRAFT_56669 [Hypholoma sublateritium FD-334 SS-4]